MQNSISPGAARLELGQPRKFKTGAVCIVSAYGLLVMFPVLLSILVLSVSRFGWVTFLLPLAAIAFATFFLPCGFGNPFIARLVRSQHPAAASSPDGFVAQLTLSPRLRTGLRALAEDADDVGWLSFTESELRFEGDAVEFSVPLEQIQDLHSRNIGWRGLFVYGRASVFAVSSLPQVEAFQVAERASYTLPASRAAARKLFERLAASQKRTATR